MLAKIFFIDTFTLMMQKEVATHIGVDRSTYSIVRLKKAYGVLP